MKEIQTIISEVYTNDLRSLRDLLVANGFKNEPVGSSVLKMDELQLGLHLHDGFVEISFVKFNPLEVHKTLASLYQLFFKENIEYECVVYGEDGEELATYQNFL